MADLKISDVTPTTPQATTRIPAVNGTTPTTVEIGAIAALSLPIGGGTLLGKLCVLSSGTINTAGEQTQDALIVGTNNPFNTGGNGANLSIQSNSAFGADVGGTIGFGGQYQGTDNAVFAIIKGAKEDARNGWFNSYLAFGTRDGGSNILERMRIDSTGKVIVGGLVATAMLQVVGLSSYADNAAAVAAGLTAGAFYYTGDLLKVVHA